MAHVIACFCEVRLRLLKKGRFESTVLRCVEARWERGVSSPNIATAAIRICIGLIMRHVKSNMQ